MHLQTKSSGSIIHTGHNTMFITHNLARSVHTNSWCRLVCGGTQRLECPVHRCRAGCTPSSTRRGPCELDGKDPAGHTATPKMTLKNIIKLFIEIVNNIYFELN